MTTNNVLRKSKRIPKNAINLTLKFYTTLNFKSTSFDFNAVNEISTSKEFHSELNSWST